MQPFFFVFDRKSKKKQKKLLKNFIYLSKTLIFAVGKFIKITNKKYHKK